MSGKGRRPTEGKKYKRSWDLIQCEAGQRVNGYVAGPHIRTKCHTEPFPKVCLKEHAGQSDCPGCMKGFDTVWYAWLPLYKEPDKGEIMAAFGEHQWDTLDSLVHLQPVTIGREWSTGKTRAFKCGLWINPTKTKDVYAPSDRVRQRDRCIAMPLIILWKYTDRITVDQLLCEEPMPEVVAEKPAKAKKDQRNADGPLTAAQKAIEDSLRAKIAKGFKERGEVGGIIAGVADAFGLNGDGHK